MSELVQGNAADVLAARPAKSIDMIYSDPPFNTGKVWKDRAGAFDDRWKRSEATDAGWAALRAHNRDACDLIRITTKDDPSMRAYIGMMAPLLLACRRSLKLTGTLWLHFDDHAGAHLRLLLEAVFGVENQLGTLIWKRSTTGAAISKGFQRVHDTIAVFARSPAARYRLWRIGHIHGDPIGAPWSTFHDFVDQGRFPPLNSFENERVGYPTQKPVSLIAHFIELATFLGDFVCDPTMGSGTSIVACEKTGRRWLGIDMSADALKVAEQRLTRAPKHQLDMFGAVA